MKGCGIHKVESQWAGRRKRTITSVCKTAQEARRSDLNGKCLENDPSVLFVVNMSSCVVMCCGCVRWCDSDEPLVVLMNNIVPPMVQSVSQQGG